MKIEANLRAVINAAAKAQKYDRPTWQERERREALSIRNFFKDNSAIAKKLRTAKVQREKLLLEISKVNKTIQTSGLNLDLKNIADSALFVKSGGVPPQKQSEPWKAETVLSALASATTEKDFEDILKSHNINWK